MMFLDRYYFLIIVAIVGSVLIFYFDINPKIIEWKRLRVENNSLISSVHNKIIFIKKTKINRSQKNKAEKYFRFDDKDAIKSELLNAIRQVAELNGLLIQSIDSVVWRSISNVNVFGVHFVANGRFAQFSSFITMLFQYSLPFVLSHFSLQVDKEGLIKMDIHVASFFMATSDRIFIQLKHGNKEMLMNDKQIYFLHAISWRQIKWVGYILNQNQSWALAKLPNGRVVEVLPGSLLGLENAKVTNVTTEGIKILVEGKEKLMRYSI